MKFPPVDKWDFIIVMHTDLWRASMTAPGVLVTGYGTTPITALMECEAKVRKLAKHGT